MGAFEIVTVVATAAVAIAGLIVLVAVFKHAPRSAAGSLIGRGDFAAALDSANLGEGAERDELIAAAVAAKHLGDLPQAAALVERVLDLDDGDGEAWMERGLIAAYAGDHELALTALGKAERRRSDLFESISLHRAWVELKAGDTATAARRFEEISAPLESKLRSDLGPGDPLFSEWFFQAADLWEESGAREKADWARREALRSAPSSLTVAEFARPA